MKWDIYRRAFERYARLSKWHRWFAWYPARLSYRDTRVWLEWVERRVDTCRHPFAYSLPQIGIYWEYRACR